jgi:hypothetical protein
LSRIAVLSLLAVSLAGMGVSHAGVAPACSSSQLRVRVQTQGGNTAARIAIVFAARSACALRGRVQFTVLVAGRWAHVRGNPLELRGSGLVRPGHTRSLLAWWGNWCGTIRGISYRAEYGSRVLVGRFNTLPACLQPHGSTLGSAGAETD